MKTTRIIAAFLLASLLTSCGSAASGTETSASDGTSSADIAETTELTRANTPDSLPEGLKFDGETIRLTCRDVEINIQELNAEQTGDIVDDAIFSRNQMVEERLGVTLEYIPVGNSTQLHSAAIKTSVMAGSDDYDIVQGSQYGVLPQSLEGIYKNLDGVKYLDLNQPWWWEGYINELKIGNKATFFLEGDICLTSIENMSCIFFNKKMAKELGIDPDGLYETVLDGKWTYDLLSEYSTLAYRDVNGDTVADENDIYGFMARPETEPDHFVYTAGNKMSLRDKNNIPSLNVNTERFSDYMTMLYELYYNNEGVWVTRDETLMRNRFAEDGTLFLINRFVSCNYLREMKSEYGIIPFPKYDESQKEYGALVHDSSSVYCIPITVSEKLDVSCAVLEALCAQSYRTVVPAYFEMALKVKYASDTTSGIIVDMIKEAATTDFAYAYNYALNNAGLLCRKMLMGKNSNFASAWAELESGAQKGLADLIKLYEEIE